MTNLKTHLECLNRAAEARNDADARAQIEAALASFDTPHGEEHAERTIAEVKEKWIMDFRRSVQNANLPSHTRLSSAPPSSSSSLDYDDAVA